MAISSFKDSYKHLPNIPLNQLATSHELAKFALKRSFQLYNRVMFNPKKPDDLNKMVKISRHETRILKFFFRDCGPMYSVDKDSNRRVIGYYSLFRNKTPRAPPRLIIWYILVGLLILTFWNVEHIRFKAGELVNQWRPSVADGTPKTEKCALQQNIRVDKNLTDAIDRHFKLLLLFEGLASYNNMDKIYIYISCSITTAATLLYIEFFMNGRKVYVDVLSFMLNPEIEIKRWKMQLKQIIADLRKSWVLHVTQGSKTSYQIPHTCCKCITGKFADEVELDSFFARFDHHMLVRPAPYNSDAFATLVKSHTVVVNLIYFSTTIMLFFQVFFIFQGEAVSRIETRREQIKCELWNPNGTLIRDPLRLKIYDPLSQVERQAYLDYDGQSWTMFSKLCEIEIYHFLNWRLVGLYLGSMFFIIFHCILIGFYLGILIGGFAFRKIWTKQLLNQFDNSIKMMENIWLIKQTNLPIELIEEQVKSVKEVLLVTYLNYELFISENTNYQRVMDSLAEIMLVICFIICFAWSITIHYASASYFTLGWLVSSLAVCLCNLIFILSISMVSDLQQIFHRINLIEGKASLISMELTSIIILWRRHSLCDREIQDIYATRVASISLTKSNLLTMNTYILGAVLFLLKYHGFQSIS